METTVFGISKDKIDFVDSLSDSEERSLLRFIANRLEKAAAEMRKDADNPDILIEPWRGIGHLDVGVLLAAAIDDFKESRPRPRQTT